MFELDPCLEQDSVFIIDLPLCQLRMENDQRFPWLLLIPRQQGLVEVTELSAAQQQQLIQESCRVSNALKKLTGCKKINVASLGNVVAQLHWHVVARFESDAAWPGPVWGAGEAQPWNEKERDEFIGALLHQLNLSAP
ncbi:HIT domain-containing protein [Corallincola luteus]|uniref:HIT domain-containing protein n=1 Tax=Corallincola luteus TaxID=1775177 RepID=A0ABY2AP47_9GAMM|nr:HIT domain-containing protein [Corallincola luteus]TCI04674.1 HIT domain-containing protein [Corallincola luteus]